jgi:hypothetical protein
MVTWGIVFALILALAYFSSRMVRQQEDDGFQDAGLAILEFGRAFPQEAIRSLHATADGKAVFVRLHDNKAGVMRSLRNHFACHLIEPGTVRVRDLPSGKGFAVEFLDAPSHNGEFTFSNPAIAAEVSLWLLGNYVSRAEREPADVVSGTTG